ncbi:hypothetical protein BDV37DRAFT_55715 [Aspergillus pseudonomiae]|uniref:Uncharacterized protein n=1 Tax=Aspergillus pseudonomiae TaxID=1506151 RepID=A0A5N7CV03_9EURO|nr:uncharacterized protein BDV37DRAFT_55715 [Aspergillus pseudonomiae]KAE8397468.1 hypothetical protein BDV37DRAFT_55715 [Aspergillus pseudonomiae]
MEKKIHAFIETPTSSKLSWQGLWQYVFSFARWTGQKNLVPDMSLSELIKR